MLLAALVASHAGGSPSISGKGRAERCYVEAGQLFVNMTYPAINEMKVPLEADYADQNDPELLRTLAPQSAEKTVILLVGRTVDYALAKQLNKEVGSEGARNGFVGRKLEFWRRRLHGRSPKCSPGNRKDPPNEQSRCPRGNHSVHIWLHSQDPKDPICGPRRPNSLAAFTPEGSPYSRDVCPMGATAQGVS